MGKLYLFTLFTYLFSYLFIVIDFCQTIYLNIYWTDLHQICKDGRTTALDKQSEVKFFIPQGMLPWQPLWCAQSTEWVRVTFGRWRRRTTRSASAVLRWMQANELN